MGPYARLCREGIMTYGLEERGEEFAILLRRIEAGKIHESMARWWWPRVQAKIKEVTATGNFLKRAPASYEELDPDGPPDIGIGTLTENPDVPFGIRYRDRPRHILIFGGTGFGKSSLLILIVKRIYELEKSAENQLPAV